MKVCEVISGNPWNFKKLEGHSGLWQLQEDITYGFGDERAEITVPEGFVYDLASVPKIFQPLLGKKEKLAVEAALLHDFAYEYHVLNRKDADLAFLSLMKRYKNPKSAWKRWIMYQAVRIFGKKPYNKQSGADRSFVK